MLISSGPRPSWMGGNEALNVVLHLRKDGLLKWTAQTCRLRLNTRQMLTFCRGFPHAHARARPLLRFDLLTVPYRHLLASPFTEGLTRKLIEGITVGFSAVDFFFEESC